MPKKLSFNCHQCNKECIDHRGAAKFCSRLCSESFNKNVAEQNRQNKIEQWLSGDLSSIKRSLIKEYLTRIFGYKCCKCGISEWQNKPITLWVDHIDGNASNNDPSNFQLICPNCDSQQETFGGKNYGKGRKALGLPQYG